ncbi:hypothetical protein GVN20_26360 [Runella sp. CRIBMP]|uniref:Trm112 family protein n=1 Tax=Runella sp. CRIBMP TaxID=2683261 RepID=UPI0014136370|nr:Trm112 family protein [Runella sp. CRIBMP]NBB22907.1 hypothetical protein [Runella sp. CRIBMP]
MKSTLVHKLCCPFDKQDLQLTIIKQDTDQNIIEGLLTCETCRRYYPIVYGIPIMNPDEYREKQLEEPILQRWSKQLGAGFKEKLLK